MGIRDEVHDAQYYAEQADRFERWAGHFGHVRKLRDNFLLLAEQSRNRAEASQRSQSMS
jgi:hypothetical protein